MGEKLDSLLDELTDLALTSSNSGTVFSSILQAAFKATGALAGAIWSVADVNFRLELEVGLVQLGIGSDLQLQAIHEDALESATKVVSASVASTGVTKRKYNSKLYRFFGCCDRDAAYLVIELVHEEDAVADTDEVLIASFMAALAEIARDFRNSQLLRRLQLDDTLWSDFKTVLPRLHASIRIDESAFRIANEGRRFLACDRLSVARFDHDKATLIAVSGVATIEKRAKQSRALESLVAIVARSGQALRYPSVAVELPQITDGLQRYLDASHSQLIWILLITNDKPQSESRLASEQLCIGALIVEVFTTNVPPRLEERSALLLEHSAIAFRNAIHYTQMPLRSLSESLQSWVVLYRNARVRLAVGSVAALCCICLAIFIPAELNIDATGTIQPVVMRHLYAPINGEVIKSHATHQSKVQAGDLLLEIRSRELELRKEELLTLRSTAQEKLRSIEVARLQNRKSIPQESISSSELSASESELREVLASQAEQLSILNEMLAALQITSPMNGQVISWDPTETLEQRPVQQGQKLISVAELSGEGKLQLRVLDQDIRHVMNANRLSSDGLRVTFSMASEPGVRHSANVKQIGTTVETVSSEGATLRVDALVSSTDMASIRPGGTVNAKIHCGKSSIGYVWTRRLVDYLLFRFL